MFWRVKMQNSGSKSVWWSDCSCKGERSNRWRAKRSAWGYESPVARPAQCPRRQSAWSMRMVGPAPRRVELLYWVWGFIPICSTCRSGSIWSTLIYTSKTDGFLNDFHRSLWFFPTFRPKFIEHPPISRSPIAYTRPKLTWWAISCGNLLVQANRFYQY